MINEIVLRKHKLIYEYISVVLKSKCMPIGNRGDQINFGRRKELCITISIITHNHHVFS